MAQNAVACSAQGSEGLQDGRWLGIQDACALQLCLPEEPELIKDAPDAASRTLTCIDYCQGHAKSAGQFSSLACTTAVLSLVDAFLYDIWFYTRDNIVDHAFVH